MISLMESEEILILSYGLGVYRFSSPKKLTLDNDSLKSFGITDLLGVDEGVYVGISNVGKYPSKLEQSLQETDEFLSDQKSVMNSKNQRMKDRFYELHKMVYGL